MQRAPCPSDSRTDGWSLRMPRCLLKHAQSSGGDCGPSAGKLTCTLSLQSQASAQHLQDVGVRGSTPTKHLTDSHTLTSQCSFQQEQQGCQRDRQESHAIWPQLTPKLSARKHVGIAVTLQAGWGQCHSSVVLIGLESRILTCFSLSVQVIWRLVPRSPLLFPHVVSTWWSWLVMSTPGDTPPRTWGGCGQHPAGRWVGGTQHELPLAGHAPWAQSI